jgi:hypothetical protein
MFEIKLRIQILGAVRREKDHGGVGSVAAEEQIFFSNISQSGGPHLEQKFAASVPSTTTKIHNECVNIISCTIINRGSNLHSLSETY